MRTQGSEAVMRSLALTVALVLVTAVVSRAGTVNDTFDGPTIDPPWTETHLSNITGWTYSFTANPGALTVTDIQEATQGPGSHAVPWASVSLDESLGGACDFDFALDFGWDSDGLDSAFMFAAVDVLTAGGGYVAGIAYQDAWSDRGGRWSGWGDAAPGTYVSSELAHSGRETIRIVRTSGAVDVRVGGSSVLSFSDTTAADEVRIRLGYYPMNTGTPTFGTFLLHDFQGSFTECAVVPLPPAALAGLGLLGALGLIRRRRRRRRD